MDNRAEVVLKTLLYFDIFDYPIKKEEIYKYLVSNNLSQKDLSLVLKTLQKKQIEQLQTYFFLKGRRELVRKRKAREKISLLKLKKAKQIIRKITFVSTIKFVGISGALSMSNSDSNDDIDIFVITHKNLIWITRFLIIIILKFLSVYRSKNDKTYSDKICLNMIVAEDKLSFNSKNLYTAHEIVQLIPIFDKDNTYLKFLKANSWIKTFLPNTTNDKKILIKVKESFSDKFLCSLFMFLNLEKIFKFLQFSYMKKSIGKEVIKEGFLGFHPFDYKNDVLRKYDRKLKEYNLKKLRI